MSDVFKTLLEIDDETTLRRDGDAAAEFLTRKTQLTGSELDARRREILADMYKRNHALYKTAVFAVVFMPEFAKEAAALSDQEIFMHEGCDILRAVKLLYEVEHGSEADHGT